MKLKNEFQIGLVGLITIIVAFFGIRFLKGGELFQGNNTLYALYDNVTGMHPGNYVSINGMKVGYILSIKPANERNTLFVVEISVEKQLKVPKDSRLVYYDSGLLTGMALKIDLGNSTTLLKDGDTIACLIQKGMMDGLTADIGSVIKRIDTLTYALNNTLDSKTQDNIKMSVENINSLTQRLNQVASTTSDLLDKNKRKFDVILSNVESITKNLANHSNEINQVITNFSNISDTIAKANVGQTLTSVNNSLEKLNSSLIKIENGKGNIGQLLNDEQLYNNITSSAKNLNLLIEDIKANPKKYIKISVF